MRTTMPTERHARRIAGVLSCCDEVSVQGTLPMFCYAEGMTAYLSKRQIRIFDFTQFVKPLTGVIKANVEELTTANGVKIGYVPKKNFRKGAWLRKPRSGSRFFINDVEIVVQTLAVVVSKKSPPAPLCLSCHGW